MLDYAANAVVYWPVERIQTAFEATCQGRGDAPEEVLLEFLEDEEATERFWGNVQTNLQVGKIRMVFVADVIPPELRRVVEFLNEQMNPAEVLALEVKQYVGQGLQTLVPRVVGQSTKAQEKRSAGLKVEKQWDEATFLTELETRRVVQEVGVAKALVDWAKRNNLRLWWGRGGVHGSCYPLLDIGKDNHYTFSVWTHGNVWLHFCEMKAGKPFASSDLRKELLMRLKGERSQQPNLHITVDETRLEGRPAVPLLALGNPDHLATFLEAFDWYIEQVRNYYQEGLA